MEIGLVLGGGGARGIAHIGVLRALDERGVKPVAIAGCSIGAVVGALAASGHTVSHLEDMARRLKRIDLLDVGKHGAILGNAKIGEYLEADLPRSFEDLRLPLKVTAVDYQTGKLLVLGSGALVPAVLGSAAIPGLLSPVFHQDWVLMDGGVLNNLPVDVIRAMTTCPVLAVDVAVPPDRKLEFEDERSLRERISDLFNRTQPWMTIELFLKAFDVPQYRATQGLLAFYPPDVLVRPKLDPELKREDFHRHQEALEAGYEAAISALENAGW